MIDIEFYIFCFDAAFIFYRLIMNEEDFRMPKEIASRFLVDSLLGKGISGTVYHVQDKVYYHLTIYFISSQYITSLETA